MPWGAFLRIHRWHAHGRLADTIEPFGSRCLFAHGHWAFIIWVGMIWVFIHTNLAAFYGSTPTGTGRSHGTASRSQAIKPVTMMRGARDHFVVLAGTGWEKRMTTGTTTKVV